MINSVTLKNFGPIESLDWQNLGCINLVIGNNDCGKSFLLKALYSAVRTLEDYRRGDNPDSAAEILAAKLYWTFQAEKVGDLVSKSSNGALSFSLSLNEQSFCYGFDKDTTKTISSLENQVAPRGDNSVFLPAKEVLSLHHLILESRRNFQFGFDDTYLDLANALLVKPSIIFIPRSDTWLGQELRKIQPPHGSDSIDFNYSRYLVRKMIGGEIEFDDDKKRWYFYKKGYLFTMGATAEGVKKIAILDYLLGNRYLNENSIIFIDEPESLLHPEAITKLLDIIALLANHGIQFFMASHSYFVINKLFLIAQNQRMSIPVLSKVGESWQQYDLIKGMPDNPIIDESIRLYEQEVDLAFT